MGGFLDFINQFSEIRGLCLMKCFYTSFHNTKPKIWQIAGTFHQG